MNQPSQPEGEFHHFQLVNQEGEIPFSISVLVHYNQKSQQQASHAAPISADEVIEFHETIQQFDGDFIKAFKKK